MKAEAEISNKTVRLSESLELFRKPYIQYTSIMLSGLIILIFAYRPLIIKLHNAANRLQEVETELLNQRNAVDALKNSDVKCKVMRRTEISQAIAELTEKGRELKLNFNSISLKELLQTTQAGIYKLPISFTIESEYKNLGQFLIYLEEFPRSIVEVESFSIRPKVDNPPKLSVELLLCLYVEVENATK